MGEYEAPADYKGKITVVADSEKKTLKFIDNGIGMTADEVEEYINQIAFSGATDFLEKYKDKANDDQIIGHFGLGFYSAFMVASKVRVESKRYGAEKAYAWESEGAEGYTIDECDKSNFGTKIILTLKADTDDEKYSDFLDMCEVKEDSKEDRGVLIYK